MRRPVERVLMRRGNRLNARSVQGSPLQDRTRRASGHVQSAAANVASRILTVDGTDNPEVIAIDYVPTLNQITVTVNTGTGGFNTLFQFDAANVNKVVLNGLGGADTLTLGAALVLPATVSGGTGGDFIQTGGGDATVYGNTSGAVDDPNVADDDILTGGPGRSTVYGQGGNDTFYNLDQGRFEAYGGAGNDRFVVGHGVARFVGNEGFDTLTYENWLEPVQIVVGTKQNSGP